MARSTTTTTTTTTVRAYVRTAVRHPAALVITGLLVAYFAIALLLQGRVLPLATLLLMGVLARLATDNMTVVFLSALVACGLYLVLQPLLLRRMREGLTAEDDGTKEPDAAAAAAATEEEKKKNADGGSSSSSMEEEAAADPPADAAAAAAASAPPSLVEQKISALQTRMDAVQAELDAAAKKTV